MRSPAMPKKGEIRVPRNCREPKSASASTDPVETSTNQPRITPSISKAQDASRSAGHWKRKLRIRKGASAGTRERVVTVRVVSWPALLARLGGTEGAACRALAQQSTFCTGKIFIVRNNDTKEASFPTAVVGDLRTRPT